MAIQLKDLDLNLLLIFHELMALRNVSTVAAKLGMTQPGISNALKRLRTHLEDDLFIRSSKGMEPTSFALSLDRPVALALESLEQTLNQKPIFDPKTSDHRFCLGMTDIGEIYFLPRLMDRLAHEAPGVTLQTVRTTSMRLQDDMQAGQVDLAMGLLPQLKTSFFQRSLFKQNYVCLLREGHPLAKESLTLQKFRQAQHVDVVAEGTGHMQISNIFQKKGITRDVKLMVPHFVALGHILSATDLIATVPERYAKECLKPFHLKYVKHPVALPLMDINIFWHAKFHKDPANQWLRQLFADMFSSGEF
jgi:DNA-binding transcriptional LysR family regulator